MKKIFILTCVILMLIIDLLNLQKPPRHYKLVMYTAPAEIDNTGFWQSKIDEGKQIAAKREALVAAELSQTNYTTSNSSSKIEACIVTKESHGDYYPKDNPTHFGKYQFDYPTWVAAGGIPSHWGNASPAEQETVFRTKVNRDGYSAWTKWDGC